MYLQFVLTAGALVYLLAQSATGDTFGAGKPYWALLACMGGVAAVCLLKHIQLALVSAVFPFGGETLFYGFLLGNTHKALGVVLLPLVFLAGYAQEDIQHWALYGALAIWGLGYLYLWVRGFILAGTYLMYNKFHFLLYICAVEIAPIAALVKTVFPGAGH